MRATALFNLKGGVGKTSTAVNLALMAARSGRQTVLWDLDAQGAATWLLAANPSSQGLKKTIKNPERITSSILHSPYPRLDLVPASFSHRKLDALLSGTRAFRGIYEALAQRYDLLVIDAPPSLAQLANNIFDVSDVVLAPVIPSPLSVRAFAQLRDYILRRTAAPKLRAFLSMVDRRRTQHNQWLIDPPESLRGTLMRSYIPYSSAVERMSTGEEPLLATQPAHPIARRYQELWDELVAAMHINGA